MTNNFKKLLIDKSITCEVPIDFSVVFDNYAGRYSFNNGRVFIFVAFYFQNSVTNITDFLRSKLSAFINLYLNEMKCKDVSETKILADEKKYEFEKTTKIQKIIKFSDDEYLICHVKVISISGNGFDWCICYAKDSLEVIDNIATKVVASIDYTN
jgi:hypothetical protein